MKKNYILLSLCILLVSCTVTIDSPIDLLINNVTSFDIDIKAKQYPYFPVKFHTFGIRYETTIVTPENTTITTKEKEIMLERLDFVRFVLNTPEFEKNILEASIYSDREIKGTKGTVTSGEKFNNRRLLDVLQYNAHSVRIAKAKIAAGAAAQAGVGTPIYVNEKGFNKNKIYTIEFPYVEQWDKGGYLQENYISGVLFHELLHNMGFSHGNSGKPDPVYGIQGVFLKTLTSEFRTKYNKKIASFKPFYKTIYKKNMAKYDSLSLDNLTTLNTDEITEVCVIYEDGTYEIRKIRNGKFI